MLFKILLKNLIGYVNIKIEGYFVEKFINKCINNKIFFWNIKREKSTIVYTNVGINEFKKIRKIAKETKCKVEILDKKGLPFLLYRYKKRKVFLIVVILIFALLIGLSRFIWNIKIEGLDKIEKSEIENILNENGLTTGKLKSSINKQKVINEIRMQRDDISWVGISIEGTNATVKIVEANSKPEIINDEEYCSIVSTKDAQIVKVSAQNGIPVVKEGDVVTKGDTLIAGWIEGKYTGTRYVHAEGEVLAKVWYSQKERILLNQVVERSTENVENKYKIKLNNFSINLFKTLSKFEKYDTIEASKKLKIFSDLYLPIELIKITNTEKVEEKITYGIEDAKQIGIDKASEKIEQEIPNKENVLQKYENSYAGEDYIDIEVTYEVLENIGTKEKIVF